MSPTPPHLVHNSTPPRTFNRFSMWVIGPLIVVQLLSGAVQRYAAGAGWLDVLGFNKALLRQTGDLVVPLFVTLTLLATSRKLPEGRFRTVITWISGSGLAFLLIWWSFLRSIVVMWPNLPWSH